MNGRLLTRRITLAPACARLWQAPSRSPRSGRLIPADRRVRGWGTEPPGMIGAADARDDGDMSAERLSALDASFLAVERPAAPMHVGWVALFDPPERGARPRFAELFDHIANRLGRAPRYRQRLAHVPLGLHEPLWVDDPGFDAAEHLLAAGDGDLDALVDSILSTPLARDRPLWEIWIAYALPGGGI